MSDEVHKLLQCKPGEVYEACQIYFQNVHKWMPVISQKLFFRRLTNFSNTKRTDFSLLLLCIFLMIHCPASATTPEPLYQIVKTSYWHLSASAEASIELVQAGLLLACYEYGSGMIEGCYNTIGQCVRMNYWMGLHIQRLPSDLPSGSDAWLENAERGNLWWGILIRDR
jgi:hypothetical protein